MIRNMSLGNEIICDEKFFRFNIFKRRLWMIGTQKVKKKKKILSETNQTCYFLNFNVLHEFLGSDQF